jgi:hypothetical protein
MIQSCVVRREQMILFLERAQAIRRDSGGLIHAHPIEASDRLSIGQFGARCGAHRRKMQAARGRAQFAAT